MKKLLLIFLIGIMTSMETYSQLEYGKYFVCLDYCYFPCHGKYFFDFKPDNKCSITWADDVSYETSDGYYYIQDSAIILEPQIRPDSIRISLIYDDLGNCKNCSYLEKQQNENENVLWLLTLEDKRLQSIKTIIYQKDNRAVELTTDSLGYATYYGAIADSICFTFQNRKFKVYPSEKHQPSFVKVYMDMNYKDLFDRIKELKYMENNYWYTYNCDNGLRKSLLRKRKINTGANKR